MDIVIRPFWIALSIAYFVLAWVHYLIQARIWVLASHVVAPATAVAQEIPGDFDKMNIAISLRQIRDMSALNKKLIRYASYGFLLAGFISLAQGVLNLDSEIAINVIFIALALVVLLIIVYFEGRWLVQLLASSIRMLWYKVQWQMRGQL